MCTLLDRRLNKNISSNFNVNERAFAVNTEFDLKIYFYKRYCHDTNFVNYLHKWTEKKEPQYRRNKILYLLEECILQPIFLRIENKVQTQFCSQRKFILIH